MPSTPYIQPMLLNGASGASLRPSLRGRSRVSTPFYPMFVQRLPTDAVGSSKFTLTGLKPGTDVSVIGNDMTVLARTTNITTGRVTFTVPRYAAGSANNTVRVFVNNLKYEVIDLNYELQSVDTTIPVIQRIDRSYKNPD